MAEGRPAGVLNVLVTGAGTGLGRGVSIELSKRGHRVTAATLTEAQAALLAEEFPALDTLVLDITDAKARARASEIDIDVLVANAGLGQAGPLRAIPDNRIRRVFDVNVFGTLGMVQAMLPQMIERGSGRILIMSSVAGVLAGPMTGPYSMTKHALQAMGSALRAELAPLGVDVALVNPGPFATGFNDHMIDATIDWLDPDTAFAHELDLIEDARRRITGAQLDPADAVATIVGLVEAETTDLVNFIPSDIVQRIRGH